MESSFWCSRKHNGIALGMYRASENLMHFTNPEHSIMCQQQRRGQDKLSEVQYEGIVAYGKKPSFGTARSVGICNVGGFRRDDGDPTPHLAMLRCSRGVVNSDADSEKRGNNNVQIVVRQKDEMIGMSLLDSCGLDT
jgi:hypothetical protein